ncbi:MAG: hypothetical protein AAB534_00885 [Patescibacteria group bacterium]
MNKNLLDWIKKCSDEEVWETFALSKKELKNRNLIRTNNIVGERGEFLVIATYNNTPGFPNLQAAPEGTQNVDALSRKGERYSIKTMSIPSKTTSVFYNCGELGDRSVPQKKFEYVVIVMIDDNLEPKKIIELTWEQFLKYRKWHKTMRGWNISVTNELLKQSKVIF